MAWLRLRDPGPQHPFSSLVVMDDIPPWKTHTSAWLYHLGYTESQCIPENSFASLSMVPVIRVYSPLQFYTLAKFLFFDILDVCWEIVGGSHHVGYVKWIFWHWRVPNGFQFQHKFVINCNCLALSDVGLAFCTRFSTTKKLNYRNIAVHTLHHNHKI